MTPPSMLPSATAHPKLCYSTSWTRFVPFGGETCPSRTSSDSKAKTSVKAKSFAAMSSPQSHTKSASFASRISSTVKSCPAAMSLMTTRHWRED